MEDVLHQLELPYDPLRPLIFFDERPCFLIEDQGTILPLSPGKAKRYDDEYAKHGSCCVFLAFEPQTGFRYLEVRQHRTAVDDAHFMHTLLQRFYPYVECVRLVQDNLNTHTPGSFYKILPPEQAFALGQRLELHPTPIKGSWLNLAECEFALLSRQCLDRRIPDVQQLRQEALAWAHRRNLQRATVHWTFTRKDARQKLERHYEKVKELT